MYFKYLNVTYATLKKVMHYLIKNVTEKWCRIFVEYLILHKNAKQNADFIRVRFLNQSEDIRITLSINI